MTDIDSMRRTESVEMWTIDAVLVEWRWIVVHMSCSHEDLLPTPAFFLFSFPLHNFLRSHS